MATDVLVIGAGGAGMYAALSAARAGADVLLVDKNMVGRGGATIMAQMTVAAALGEEEPDTWQAHLADTLAAGRGLCDSRLAEVLCREAPARMRELDDWGVGWARAKTGGEQGPIRQVMAPGHDRKRCCYVDFLDTGPAVAGTLRKMVGRAAAVRRISGVSIVELVTVDGRVVGAIGLDLESGQAITIEAASTIIATGGLTKLYARTSASNNMSGEGYALALRAGAELIDMEFVQFFPIGHLAPRLVGMDPIMWDPFRYKLGGRLLNGNREPFVERYGAEDAGRYTVTRDVATYAIISEVAAGRGSPHGGAYLSFEHIEESVLREAFGPVIDRLLANGIDLGKAPVEVAPLAHYHMGGVRVSTNMSTTVEGLFAAGEAVGGASGANRLSGNAITEALVFGEIAGRSAAQAASNKRGPWPRAQAEARAQAARAPTGRSLADTDVNGNAGPTTNNGGARHEDASTEPSAVSVLRTLRELMWKDVGAFRTAEGLERAISGIQALRARDLATIALPGPAAYASEIMDWHELDAALLVADVVARTALARRESRGAHQRHDFPELDASGEVHQIVRADGAGLSLEERPV